MPMQALDIVETSVRRRWHGCTGRIYKRGGNPASNARPKWRPT